MHLDTRVIVLVCVCLQPRQTVLTAAGSIGQASGDLLRQIGENETDERFQVRLQPPATDSTEPEDKMDRVVWFGLILNRQACLLFRQARAWLNHRCYFFNQCLSPLFPYRINALHSRLPVAQYTFFFLFPPESYSDSMISTCCVAVCFPLR